jgi:hypothetical protein
MKKKEGRNYDLTCWQHNLSEEQWMPNSKNGGRGA